MTVFDDIKCIEEYRKKHPTPEPIGIKVIMKNGEIIKILGLYYEYDRKN